MESRNPAVLLLEDGSVYHSDAMGKIGTSAGENAFNTGMTGYQEIFTDPSYYGQLMVTTNAHIGNYGVSEIDIESNSPKIAGLICKNFNTSYSRPAANNSLQNLFIEHNIVAISDVDTRALVSHIRDNGAMNAVISTDINSIETLKLDLSKLIQCLKYRHQSPSTVLGGVTPSIVSCCNTLSKNLTPA